MHDKNCLAVLVALVCLCLPGWTVAQDATRLINTGLRPVLVKKTEFPYRLKQAKDKTGVRIKLKKKSESKNEITDTDEWFHKNVLPRPLPKIEENYRYVPAETRWGKLAFFRTSNNEEHVAIYVAESALEKALDNGLYATNYTYTAVLFDRGYKPIKLFILEEFHPSILEMNSAFFVDRTLYFDCNFNGYASIMKKKTGYLVALDLDSGKVAWASSNLTSAYMGFIVYKDVVIAGYGFTDEPDHLFVLNRHTGKVLQKIKLKTAHDFLVIRDGVLFVRTYDRDYQFDIIEK